MTTLKDRLQADLTVHLKAHEELPTTTLRNILGAIQTAEKSGKVSLEFTDANVLDLLAGEVKKRLKVADEYQAAVTTATDETRAATLRLRIAQELAEVEFIKQYLPTQLTAAELETIVTNAIKETGATTGQDFGKVMKIVAPATKGLADGKAVTELVRSKLA